MSSLVTLALLTSTESKEASSQLDFIQISGYTCLVTLLPSASTKQLKCKQLLQWNRGAVYALVGNMGSMLRKAAESEDSLSRSSQKTQKVTYCELVRNCTKSNCGLTVFFSLLDLLVHKYVLLNDIL